MGLRTCSNSPLLLAARRFWKGNRGGRGAETEAYELGRVLEELPPGALGLGHPDRRHHLLLPLRSKPPPRRTS